MGALDVCPFIPVQNVTMDDCVECAKEFGEKLSIELGVPVYLYGEASQSENRKTLPQIRSGEYEALPEKLTKQEWKPDFGPAEFIPSWGATVVGARKFLIAYNINLLSTKEQAHRIALNIREQGRGSGEVCCLLYVKTSSSNSVFVCLSDQIIGESTVLVLSVCRQTSILPVSFVHAR